MTIRRFLTIVFVFLITIVGVGGVSFHIYTSYDSTKNMEEFNGQYRFTKLEEDNIQVLSPDGDWDNFEFRGVELSGFSPRAARNSSKIKKQEFIDWFQSMSELNINLIKVPSVLSPSFYNALSTFNKKNETPC